MLATWYLVKYMSDVRRREPRNVGLLLHAPDRWHTRFVAERDDGKIGKAAANRHGIKIEVYETWIKYYRRKIAADAWGDVERAQRSRVNNYFTELGGQVYEEPDSWAAMTDRLFHELVEVEPAPKDSTVGPREKLLQQIHRIFTAARIVPEANVEVNARYDPDGKITKVPFEFGYQNGRMHLMEGVPFYLKGAEAARHIRDLRARQEAAKRANTAYNFVSFYSLADLQRRDIEDALVPIEKISHTLNVDDTDDATQTVASMMAHA